MTTIRQSFLDAICREPDDLTHRAAFADWLMENGEHERGEFIQVQLELDRLRKQPGWVPDLETVADIEQASMLFRLNNHDREQRIEELRRRERELLGPIIGGTNIHEAEMTWLDGTPLGFGREVAGGGMIRVFEVEWRCGFVEVVCCRLNDWVGHACNACMEPNEDVPHPKCRKCGGIGRVDAHGPAIVKAAPIVDAKSSDRQPWGNSTFGTFANPWGWQESQTWSIREPYMLPPLLFALLRPAGYRKDGFSIACYPSKEAALVDLSRAVVRWARTVAGLPIQ